MEVIIRSDTVEDYARIAELHALAFQYNQSVGEAVLVGLHRHRPLFDPDLSLVAEVEGEVVGHVLFSPHQVLIRGEWLSAVALSPMAVHPDFQREGIGSRLIEEGHRRATIKGHSFSFVLGHPHYYPRFGYRQGMFGSCYLSVDLGQIEDMPGTLAERRVEAADVPLLADLWLEWYGDCDLAVYPGETLMNWISPDRGTISSVVQADDRIVGYIRYKSEAPHRLLMFLGRTVQDTLLLLSYCKQKAKGQTELILPLHPRSHNVQRQITVPFQEHLSVWEAGMIKILDKNQPLIVSYCNEVSAGERPPGVLQWPVEFDVL